MTYGVTVCPEPPEPDPDYRKISFSNRTSVTTQNSSNLRAYPHFSYVTLQNDNSATAENTIHGSIPNGAFSQMGPNLVDTDDAMRYTAFVV